MGGLIVTAVSLALAAALWLSWRKARRMEYIRTLVFPPGLFDKVGRKHPHLSRKDHQLVAQGLRHFFLAHLLSGRRFVSMPSQVADDLWHEFILYTRNYALFCNRAFGRFLHHTPAVALGRNRDSNAGLRRVWWHCCRMENIDPRNPLRLPLLFALDTKLQIAGGFAYVADCAGLRRDDGRDGGGAHCGGDMSDPAYDGGTDGFGDGGGDGSGDSGGCGGGGGGCGD